MAPRPKPTLPASLFTSANNQPSGLATPASTGPSDVVLVLSGTAGSKAADQVLQRLLEDGLRAGHKTKVKSVVYQLAQDEKIETLDQFQVAKTTSGIPITAIQPLLSLPPDLKLPPPSAPAHLTLSFSLPTIQNQAQLNDHLEEWNEVLKQAHERKYTLEFNLTTDEKVREGFEELLGKNFEKMVKDGSNDEKDDAGENVIDFEKGAKFVIDNFGSPPLDLSSSELLRSESLRSWAEFISRLALHPRLYVKLSPIFSSISRPSDSASKLKDATTSIVEASKDASSKLVSSSQEDQDELKRKIRIYLDVLLEAFGEDRLIFSSQLKYSENLISGDGVQEWFEIVREKLADMGVNEDLMNKVFRDNASKVYRI